MNIRTEYILPNYFSKLLPKINYVMAYKNVKIVISKIHDQCDQNHHYYNQRQETEKRERPLMTN